jgi:hypothetical protein
VRWPTSRRPSARRQTTSSRSPMDVEYGSPQLGEPAGIPRPRRTGDPAACRTPQRARQGHPRGPDLRLGQPSRLVRGGGTVACLRGRARGQSLRGLAGKHRIRGCAALRPGPITDPAAGRPCKPRSTTWTSNCRPSAPPPHPTSSRRPASGSTPPGNCSSPPAAAPTGCVRRRACADSPMWSCRRFGARHRDSIAGPARPSDSRNKSCAAGSRKMNRAMFGVAAMSKCPAPDHARPDSVATPGH